MAQGSIKKRELPSGAVRWDVVLDGVPINGKRNQEKKTFKTKKEASSYLAARKVELDTGTAVPRSKQTVGEYMAYWLETSARHRVRASTLESYANKVRLYIVPLIGTTSLQKLTPADVQALYSTLLAGDAQHNRAPVSPRTVRYVHSILHRALKEAIGLNLVARNATEAVAPPKAVRPPVKSWDVAEVQRFLDVAATDGYNPLWLLALHTGMRRGELLGLRWQDVDLAQGVLRVFQIAATARSGERFTPPKTASGRRTIALDAPSIAALREHRIRQNERRLALGQSWQDFDLVFPSDVGTPIDHNNLYHRFIALTKRAGVLRIPFHGLRHTHATLLMKQRVHPKVVSERLGHADITLTLQTYSHVLPQMQQEAADIFANTVKKEPVDLAGDGTAEAL